MKTCFILDPDKDFLIFAERNLTLQGYQVQLFSDPQTFFDALKKAPSWIILGNGLGQHHSDLDIIRRTRAALPKALIIHVALTTYEGQDVEAVRAGASEFVEKNSATFVRLRTSLELLEKQHVQSTFLSQIKKAFTR
jgi:ActR/RegA family two-component response regulator